MYASNSIYIQIETRTKCMYFLLFVGVNTQPIDIVSLDNNKSLDHREVNIQCLSIIYEVSLLLQPKLKQALVGTIFL